MEDKTILTLNGDHLIAQLILEQARYQSKCVGATVDAVHFKLTSDSIREAANLVFLCLELIQERDER